MQIALLAIEYNPYPAPTPPYDAGAPSKTPTEIVDLVRALLVEDPTAIA